MLLLFLGFYVVCLSVSNEMCVWIRRNSDLYIVQRLLTVSSSFIVEHLLVNTVYITIHYIVYLLFVCVIVFDN